MYLNCARVFIPPYQILVINLQCFMRYITFCLAHMRVDAPWRKHAREQSTASWKQDTVRVKQSHRSKHLNVRMVNCVLEIRATLLNIMAWRNFYISGSMRNITFGPNGDRLSDFAVEVFNRTEPVTFAEYSQVTDKLRYNLRATNRVRIHQYSVHYVDRFTTKPKYTYRSKGSGSISS